jgi:hypothetical protein
VVPYALLRLPLTLTLAIMFGSGGPSFPSVLAHKMSSELIRLGRGSIAEQSLRLVVPLQVLAGAARAFAFLTYPWPRLTYEQRCAIELKEYEPITLVLDGTAIQIDLDEFGQINRLKINDGPDIFNDVEALMKNGQSSQ